jgi:hypothetical protein
VRVTPSRPNGPVAVVPLPEVGEALTAAAA